MRAAFPARVIAAVVAGQARLVDFGGLHLRELPDVPLRVVVDVRLARAVAALAAVRGGRRARILRLRVLGAFQRVALVGVTDDARVAAGITRRQGRWRLGRLRLRRW